MPDQWTSATGIVAGVTGDHRLILSRDTPLDSARELVQRTFSHGLTPTLQHQGGMFFEWRGSHYAQAHGEELQAAIARFLDTAQRIENDRLTSFDPKPRDVSDILAMLRTAVQLEGSIRAPAWLDRRTNPPASEIFSCANGLLHLPTRSLHQHTPAFFGHWAVDYSFDPQAPAPREWLAFLRSIWPDDDEPISALQEIFGYLLTPDTAQQKAFLIVGPPRSGKGTLGRVLTALLGKENVAGPTLASLATNFGLQPLIGKPLAIVSDARLGGRADQSVIVERLLSITGEDALTIDRKFREPWTGRLPTRLMILTNELPRLTDASQALASRFVLLRMLHSFLGREDHGLEARIVAERPGILNWAMDGRDRLAARHQFVLPASSLQFLEALADLSSPVGAFLRDCVSFDAGSRVECERLFNAWTTWCRKQGRDHPGTAQTFGRDLQAALPTVKVTRPRDGGGGLRRRFYEGIGLSGEGFDGGGRV